MGRKTKMNNITSPELLEQVNPENLQLLNDFMDYLRSTDKSEATMHGYRNDIEIAFVWNLQHNGNKPFTDWTKRNVMAYQNWLINENENSPARVRRLRASLSSMSEFIENILDEDYPNFRNIINKIKAPVNTPVREKTVMTEEEVEDLLQKVVDKKRFDVACLIALAAYGGRRKAELCQFKVNDFTDEHLVCGGSLWKSSPMRTKGHGKLGKVVPCYTLVSKFKPYLDLWMEERKRRGIESEWLFPGDTPEEHIKISTVNSWMNMASRISGREIYSHAFRHFQTTMLSEAGIPDNVIKELQHWSSVALVDIYRDTSTEDLLDAYFGEEGIKKREQKGLADL